MFPVDAKGAVKGGINTYGWLAAGVPGTLAGLQLALDRYGTRPFAKLVQPAIDLARDGFPVSKALASAIQAGKAQLSKDPAAAQLLFDQGQPLKPGSTYRNRDLAGLLQSLAASRRSADSFYEGAIARDIVAAFKKNGGLVTGEDLFAYRARELPPLALSWRGYTIYTAPLTAGGLSVLQALNALKALQWDKCPTGDRAALHAQLEALRIAGDDRLKLLGDPDKADVPAKRLLSDEYARQSATRVEKAVREQKPLGAETDGRSAGGTVHLSAVDEKGM